MNISALLRLRLGAASPIPSGRLVLAAAAAAALLLAGGDTARADILYASTINSPLGNLDYIYKFSSSGAVSTFGTLPTYYNPVALAFDAAGNLYVGGATAFQSNVVRFDSSGAMTVIGVGTPSNGLAFDHGGRLYVSTYTNNNSSILRFNLSGQTETFADASDGLNGVWGMAFDAAGNLYAASANTNQILKFDITTGVGTVFADSNDGLSNPRNLAFDKAGNLFVSSAGNNTILRLAPDGYASVFADIGSGITFPSGLAFDSVGRLYVANSSAAADNTILRFTPEGHVSFFTYAFNNPFGLAFTDDAGRPLLLPVPEPGSALLLGAGALVLGLRRRRKG